MYSTCIFCHSELGSNEAIENFPVGRRLAFDAAKGRLWAVCRRCERWNLTPLEERWEAIEECERSFRETRLRVSTDQIGLGKLREGLELVRIGKPLRPEFAAWRYGDQFGRRRRRNIVRMGAIVTAGATIPFLGPAVGLSLGAFGTYGFQVWNIGSSIYRNKRVVVHVRDERNRTLQVRRMGVNETVMLPPTRDEPWGLRIKHRAWPSEDIRWWQFAEDEHTDIRGPAAMRAAALLLPRINEAGANRRQLDSAIQLALEYEDPTIPFENAARLVKRSWMHFGKGAMLQLVPLELRLALEMVSHEDAERRAMEGELTQLEEAWREAEEIAGISDNLFLPDEVTEQLKEIKSRSGSSHD